MQFAAKIVSATSATRDEPAFDFPNDHCVNWSPIVCQTAVATLLRFLLRRLQVFLRRRGIGVSRVLLVGGATRMPVLIERVKRLFGREPRHRLEPSDILAALQRLRETAGEAS